MFYITELFNIKLSGFIGKLPVCAEHGQVAGKIYRLVTAYVQPLVYILWVAGIDKLPVYPEHGQVAGIE